MNFSGIGDLQVHDLLRIDPDCLTAGCVSEPSWVRESLIFCPWVVVRRAQAPVGQIAVGVRGTTRSERWGGFCENSVLSKIVRPPDLLVLGRSSARIPRTPALKSLAGGHCCGDRQTKLRLRDSTSCHCGCDCSNFGTAVEKDCRVLQNCRCQGLTEQLRCICMAVTRE